ncbi:hypothetical protein [Thiomicrorhabdus sp. 6S3-12]|uniref:hypothetical protein n=1 Tax=Thiomicrorhabdus sp. 6S3-12 TaxID=2819681 RepID=UPI001AADF4DC|nr:hypothetical protein [Thiomicrorhabdus sp. 6S3-12]MBO1922928.1 hypothetical protein [Thiomicrorhabdus sp. 6S3-12]
MSCCSGGYCQFKFPEGPPIVDDPVSNLQAKYQFLPYGTLLQQGEVVRIWMESGKTKTVVIDRKIPLQVLPGELKPTASDEVIPWQLVAHDSGVDYEELINWYRHPLHNPSETPVLMVYGHLVEKKLTLKERWLSFLYKMRNLGR